MPAMLDDLEAQVLKQAEIDRRIEAEIARRRRVRRRLLLAVMILVIGVGGLLVWRAFDTVTQPEASAEDFFAEAFVLSRQGELGQAIRQLKRALQIDPEHLSARWLLGKSYLSLGDGSTARKEITHARLLGYQGPEVELALLEAMLLERRYTELLVEAISAAAGSAERAVAAAEAQMGLGHPDKALETLTEVLSRADHAGALLAQGRVYLSIDRPAAARDAVERAARLDPRPAESDLLLARLALEAGEYRQARSSFDRFLATVEDHPEGHFGRAQTFLAEGQPDAALQEIALIEPSGPEVDLLRVVAAQQRGDLPGARATLRNFLKENPEHLDGLYLLAAINRFEGEHRQAEATLERLLALSPSDAPARRQLAAVELELGLADEALRTLDELPAEEKSKSETLALEARAWLGKGDSQRAQALLSQATQNVASTGVERDADEAPWRLERCGVLVHYCERCLYLRECG